MESISIPRWLVDMRMRDLADRQSFVTETKREAMELFAQHDDESMSEAQAFGMLDFCTRESDRIITEYRKLILGESAPEYTG
jgi:hypothetical protein